MSQTWSWDLDLKNMAWILQGGQIEKPVGWMDRCSIDKAHIDLATQQIQHHHSSSFSLHWHHGHLLLQLHRLGHSLRWHHLLCSQGQGLLHLWHHQLLQRWLQRPRKHQESMAHRCSITDENILQSVFNHSTWIKPCTSNLSIPRSVLFLDSWNLKAQDKLILGAYTQEQTPSDRIPADCLWLILRSDLVNIKLHYLSSFQTTRKHPLRCLWDLWGDFAVSRSGRWVLRT